jgi:hypothetical protein
MAPEGEHFIEQEFVDGQSPTITAGPTSALITSMHWSSFEEAHTIVVKINTAMRIAITFEML